MMCLPLERQLEMERLLYGRDRRIAEPPPVLLELWERGRAAGYPLGRLYVLDAPLVPGVGGTYHRPSGDVWVHHDADAPDATVVRLLHEIGHAARRARATRATIAGYCHDEAATQRLAYRLARRWGVGHRFTTETRDRYIALMQRRREELPEAGDIAGSHALHVATTCLDDLRRIAGLHGWDDPAWEALLWGYGDDGPLLTAAVELDRCRFRPCWSLGWGYGEGFEALALSPTSAAAELLREGLTRVARGRAPRARRLLRHRRSPGGTPYRHAYIPLWYERDLTAFLAVANLLLLGEPAWGAEASWAIYGTAGDDCRIYTLEVSYRAPIGERPAGEPPPDARVWCPVFRAGDAAEAALQLYIRGWRRCTALRPGSLRDACVMQATYETTVPCA